MDCPPRWTFPDGFPPDGIPPDGFPRDGFPRDGFPPMDFPPMDWGAFLNPATLEHPLIDTTGTPATGDANGVGGISRTHHPDMGQASDADIISKLGVCSSCKKYDPFSAHKTFFCR
jgi:hypothetical protein